MNMTEKPLSQNRSLQESDLTALIAAGARENRFLEFKREYLPETPSGKKKFLQAVAAFANIRNDESEDLACVGGLPTPASRVSVGHACFNDSSHPHR
jgi:hypothetical protein